jgi:hypothetical protein
MSLITLDVPNELHLKVKQIQLEKEIRGEKINLKEIYYQVIEKGLESIMKQNPTK